MSQRFLPSLMTIAFIGLAVAGGANNACAAWPEAPIRVVIPYSPGSAGDIAFRKLTPALTKSLGQPVIVDYKAGAGGNIGAAEVARAKPDGYTLLLGATNNFVINQFLYKNMAFDPLVDLVPIARVADVPSILFVNSGVPAHTFAEFARFAKAHPGQLNYGSPGAGTAPHLSAYALSEAIGASMTHVPYKGAQPGVTGLLSNDVQMFLVGYSVAGAQVASGRIRALAVASKQRLTAMPAVPTMAEAGAPDVVLSNWWGLAAPRGTPAPVVKRIADDLKAAANQPGMISEMAAQGFIVTEDTPEAFSAELKVEAQAWQRIVKASTVTLD